VGLPPRSRTHYHTHSNHDNPISIPNHKRVKKQTLKAILRGIGITDEQYKAFFHS